MLFNTPLFLYFFAAFFLLYGTVFLRRTPRVWLILVGSLVFYAGWNYRFIPLLVLSSLVDYGVALGLERTQGRERLRKALLAVSVATNLGILAAFKYSSFLLDSVGELATALTFGKVDWSGSGHWPSRPLRGRFRSRESVVARSDFPVSELREFGG